MNILSSKIAKSYFQTKNEQTENEITLTNKLKNRVLFVNFLIYL